MAKTVSVAIWRVDLNDGDWYSVFSISRNHAIALVCENHYSDLTRREFENTYKPTVKKLPSDEVLTVCTERGEEKKTAAEWLAGETPGLFSSNTYEI